MSRFRIWGFTALVVAAGLAGTWVFTQRAAGPAASQVASVLRSGSLQFETGTRLLARQVRDVAMVAVRDPALHPASDLGAAAEAALQSAADLLEVEPGRAPLVGYAQGPVVSLRLGERRLAPTDPLVQAILGSDAPPRHVRADGAIYALAVVVGDRGLRLAFGLPVDPRWTERLQAATGADLTLVGPKLVSTLPAGEAEVVAAAAIRGDGVVVDAGRLGPLSAAAGLPAIPILFLSAPAYRARALSLPGIQGPVAVVSAPTRPSLEPVAAFQQAMLLGLLLLALVGAAIGVAQESAVAPQVPRELAAVADRIARGDFDARVPRMSGTYGTLAQALARASEAARLARIATGAASPAAGLEQPVPGRATPPRSPANGATGPVAAMGTRSTPPRSIPTPAPFSPPRPASSVPATPAPTLDVPLHAVSPEETTGSRPLGGEPFSAAGLAPPVTPAPIPLAPAETRSEPRPDARPAAPFGAPPLTAAAAVQAAQAARLAQPRTTQPIGPVVPEDEEGAWRALLDEFLRVRASCGESAEGITWERFREKLRKNRDTLVQKYACRTVRFQVYVKDGRAALRATPIR